MKKIIISLPIFLQLCLFGFTQEINSAKVPAPLKPAFTKKFPEAMEVKYFKYDDYCVNFKDKGLFVSANFNETGKWLETFTEMQGSDLPGDIKAVVDKKFSGLVISGTVLKEESPDKGLFYRVWLTYHDNSGCEVRFSPTGKIIGIQHYSDHRYFPGPK
jgi:hypothetical protein